VLHCIRTYCDCAAETTNVTQVTHPKAAMSSSVLLSDGEGGDEALPPQQE